MRFSRWNKTGVWKRGLAAVSGDADLEEVSLDSTAAVRAHLHAAGAKKHGPQALGRSRGGWGTKVPMIADALGNPLSFALTGAEQADITHALTADKGYDADALVEKIETSGANPNIPPRSNRKPLRNYDRHRYNARHLIENLFARLKQFRRLATRYDKLAIQFAAFVILASISV